MWSIQGVEINGGFLPGVNLNLTEGLTCIIGPRGSGKPNGFKSGNNSSGEHARSHPDAPGTLNFLIANRCVFASFGV